jgi:hypothetical protein
VKVYLSSDRRDRFFIDAVKTTVSNIDSKFPLKPLDLMYPPDALGVDTGEILGNVLQILQSDIILVNVTPSPRSEALAEDCVKYNPSVVIEYGIVLGQAKSPNGHRWMGRMPEPTHRVFCGNEFPRTRLPPLLNHEDVISFDRTTNGERILIDRLEGIITSKISERLGMEINPPEVRFQP